MRLPLSRRERGHQFSKQPLEQGPLLRGRWIRRQARWARRSGGGVLCRSKKRPSRGGGEQWRNMGVGNWRTKGALLGTILLLVCFFSRHLPLIAANTYLERTFLAWLRTSLSFASIGIAI